MSEVIRRHDDEAIGALALLGAHEPDRARDARVRARCHAALEKRRRLALSPARPDWRRTLEPAIVGAFCAVYLFEVLSRAVLLYRF
jgi:hypothetical protein